MSIIRTVSKGDPEERLPVLPPEVAALVPLDPRADPIGRSAASSAPAPPPGRQPFDEAIRARPSPDTGAMQPRALRAIRIRRPLWLAAGAAAAMLTLAALAMSLASVQREIATVRQQGDDTLSQVATLGRDVSRTFDQTRLDVATVRGMQSDQSLRLGAIEESLATAVPLSQQEIRSLAGAQTAQNERITAAEAVAGAAQRAATANDQMLSVLQREVAAMRQEQGQLAARLAALEAARSPAGGSQPATRAYLVVALELLTDAGRAGARAQGSSDE